MKHGRSLGLVSFLCLAAGGAYAQGGGGAHNWYAGIDYGQSQLDMDDASPGAVERDDNSDAFAIRVGYRFSRYFSLEAGYTDVGSFSASYVPPCPPGPLCQPYDTKQSIDGLLVSALGTWPVAEHFHLKGALGAIYREFEASVTYPTSTTSYSERSTVLSFGVGIAVPITDRFEVDLDYTHYREIGLGLTLSSTLGIINEGESSVTTLGVRFRF